MADDIKAPVVSANLAAKNKHADDIAEIQKNQAAMAAPNPKHTYIPPSKSVKVEAVKTEEKK